MKCRKPITLIATLALAASSFFAGSPAHAQRPDTAVAVQSQESTLAAYTAARPDGGLHPGAEQQGPKSFLAKKALNAISGMLRRSGDDFIDFLKRSGKGDWLDDQAADAIKKNNHKIADTLDEIAELPDVMSHSVKEHIYNNLKGSLVDGNAEMIAEIVYGALWIVL